MTLFNYFYIELFLIIHAKYLFAYQCYECNGIFFNYSITIDHLPSPISDDCEIVTAEEGCFVRIGWFNNGRTEVYYTVDPDLAYDSVLAAIERRVTTWSGEYVTNKYIGYSCKSLNTTPCNTVENLKRAIISTTFSNDEQIEKFDKLIVPTTDFDGRLCLQISNMTDCPKTNLVSCQQCMSIIQYSKQIDTCAMCPAGKATTNFFDYYTTFFLNNKTQSDRIRLGCRKYGACNSMENIEQIKKTLITTFNFDKFNHSTASITKLSIIILFIIKFCHLL